MIRILIFLFSIFSFSQNENIREIYIKFDQGSVCNNNENALRFEEFTNHYRNGAFYICGKCFRVKANTTIKLMLKETVNTLIISPKEMMLKCQEKGMKYVFNPNHLFSKIFILDDYDGNDKYYLLYEVEVVYYNPN